MKLWVPFYTKSDLGTNFFRLKEKEITLFDNQELRNQIQLEKDILPAHFVPKLLPRILESNNAREISNINLVRLLSCQKF